MNISKWLSKNTHDLAGKTVVITGATGGIGKQIAFHLASLHAKLIFCDRNLEKSLALKQSILTRHPNAHIENLKLDLTSFENVKRVTEELKLKQIDILIHNAGIYNVPRFKTDAGFDNIFQVNFLSPYYITKQLLPTLKKSSIAKVVAVGSIAHNYSKIDENDFEFLTRKKSSLIYGNSKRFLIFSLLQLFKNEKEVSLSIAHPGITLTNMTNHYPKAINCLVKLGIKLLFPSPNKASLSIIKAIFEDCNFNEWIGPSTFNIWGKPKMKALKTASNEEQEKIFQIAEDLYNKLIFPN